MDAVPERDDVVWISMTPHDGHEPVGRRPAPVLSPAAYNGMVGLAILCPIASQVKGYPFEVPLPTGLLVEGAVPSDEAKGLDGSARRAGFACRLPPETVRQVLLKLGTLLAA